jgi:hypothetical protein
MVLFINISTEYLKVKIFQLNIQQFRDKYSGFFLHKTDL